MNGSTLLNQQLYKDYCFCIAQSLEALSVNSVPSSVDLRMSGNYVRADLVFTAIAVPDVAATPLLVGAEQRNYGVTLIIILHHDIGLHFNNNRIDKLD